MPVTRAENLARLRDLLDNPQPQHPSVHQRLRAELSEERDIVNETNNSGVAWATADYQLNYIANQTKYDINVDDFGKVLYVLKVTGNPYIPYLPVPFQDVTRQNYGTIWYNNNYAQAFSLEETPERMAFSRDGVLNANVVAEIQPAPQQSAVYLITYLPGYIGNDDPLESALQLPEHCELVRLRAAMALLPYAKWSEDENENRVKRKELAAAYAYQLERKEANYRSYIKNINKPRTVTIDGWNSWN